MAAPRIPNLLSMRGRGSGRGRRGGGSALDDSSSEDPAVAAAKQDQIIQRTDTDANLSRLSAVEAGYLNDPFAADFAPGVSSQPGSSRRMPIINRGTYARTTAIDLLVNEFLTANPDVRKQIISLGAGSDTRVFRLMSKDPQPNVVYHELDFPSNTIQKLAIIQRSARLKSIIGAEEISFSTGSELHCARYDLHPIDLRTLKSDSDPKLRDIDSELPTLILSECCLTYLNPDAADAVMNYFAITCLKPDAPLGFALYEPINPFDSFGRVMISNLAARGIVLQTVHKYCSLDAQKDRMKSYGLQDGQGAVDADFVLEHWIDETEKERLNRVEMLDEVEELKMLLRHYSVAWGWRNGFSPDTWNGWQKIKSQ